MSDRARREPDPFLDWKVRVFFCGAALLGAGVLADNHVLVVIAILVLVVGLFATTILGKRQRRAQEAADLEDPEQQAPPGE